MGLSFKGLDQVKVMLKRAKELPVACQSELKVLALELRDTARHMAPEEFHDLKDAITHREYAAQGANNLFQKGLRGYEVYVNNAHRVGPQRNEKQKNYTKQVETVGEYAWLVHEHMGYGNTPGAPNNSEKGSFMPSDESVAIGRTYGVDAGGKFLERAGMEIALKMQGRLGAVVIRHIAALDI